MKNLIFGLMAVTTLFLSGCGKDKTLGGSNPLSGDTITDIQKIIDTAPSKRVDLVGKRVELRNVPVQAVTGWVIWMGGPDRGDALPFVKLNKLRGHNDTFQIKAGQVLDISGTIGDVSNPENPSGFWKMINAAERGEITAKRIYIGADDIRTSSSSPLP